LEAEKVLVRQGKGSKDRIVMLPSTLKPLLEKWFRLTKDSEYYISSYNDGKFPITVLAGKFRIFLDKAKLRVATFKTSMGQQRYAYSFHTLRHTYATYLLERGVDLYYVQRSLGHVDIHTTQIYAYISNSDLQNKINMAFGKKQSKEKEFVNVDDPLRLLKLKFANNELSQEEFRQRYELLQKMEEKALF
ncbi:MAG: tyrosine-type recombinase/integrase, partial [Nanoarchaeota archaeon]